MAHRTNLSKAYFGLEKEFINVLIQSQHKDHKQESIRAIDALYDLLGKDTGVNFRLLHRLYFEWIIFFKGKSWSDACDLIFNNGIPISDFENRDVEFREDCAIYTFHTEKKEIQVEVMYYERSTD